MINKIRTLIGLGGFLLLISNPVAATEYSVDSNLKVNADHNDNVRLTPKNHISLQGREVRPEIDAKVAGETWQGEIDTTLSFNNFNRSEYDSDDQYVDLKLNKNTERSQFGLQSNLTRDSTRTSEIDTSGIVGARATRRVSYSGGPYWAYQVTERSRVSLDAEIERVDYADNTNTDYKNSSLSADWITQINEVASLEANIYASKYDNEGISLGFGIIRKTESKNFGVRVGGIYQPMENLKVTALLGSKETRENYRFDDPLNGCQLVDNLIAFDPNLSKTLTSCAVTDFRDRGFTGNINVDWNLERSSLEAGYGVIYQPSGQGYTYESKTTSASWKYQVSKTSHARLDILYGQNRAVGASLSNSGQNRLNRDYANFTSRYGFRLTGYWWIEAAYIYRWQDRDVDSESAESNTIKLGIRYAPTMKIWSR